MDGVRIHHAKSAFTLAVLWISGVLRKISLDHIYPAKLTWHPATPVISQVAVSMFVSQRFQLGSTYIFVSSPELGLNPRIHTP